MPVETVLGMAALALVTGALLLLGSVSGDEYSARVLQRMGQGQSREGGTALVRGLVSTAADRLAGAGIEPRPLYGWLLALLLLVTVWVAGHFGGLTGLLAAPAALAALLYGLWAWRLGRRARLLLEALPAFLGFMLRALRSGASMEQALDAARGESEGVIRETFERVLRQTRLGLSLDQALLHAAELYRLRELDMLALGLRVTHRYGGDLGQIMEQLVALIQQQRQARAELRALTGETRFSAWVLGGLPLTLAGYIMAANPGYLNTALATEGGRWLLGGAVIWQVLGLLLLRRMVKSV